MTTYHEPATVPCIKCGGKGFITLSIRNPGDSPLLPPPLREYECDECDGWGEIFRDTETKE